MIKLNISEIRSRRYNRSGPQQALTPHTKEKLQKHADKAAKAKQGQSSTSKSNDKDNGSGG